MNIHKDIQLFLTVIEQKAAQNGYPINVTYRDEADYVRDYFIQVGHQTFQMWHNVKVDTFGWKEYYGF